MQFSSLVGVGGARVVWSVSDREAMRNEGLAGGRGDEWDERRDCWGCQQHVNTHLTAGGDIFSNSVPRFDIW